MKNPLFMYPYIRFCEKLHNLLSFGPQLMDILFSIINKVALADVGVHLLENISFDVPSSIQIEAKSDHQFVLLYSSIWIDG